MMELQLGLALPSNQRSKTKSTCNIIKGFKGFDFDLNSCESSATISTSTEHSEGKRSFDEAFEGRRETTLRPSPTLLPLLLWDHQPPNEEDDPKDFENHNLFAYNKSDGEEDGIVGWPPIKFQRKQSCYRPQNQSENSCAECHGKRPPKSMYVKVKVEGVVIARKIDVTLYRSFGTLKETLLGMFCISQESSGSYKLTYQDREGDWLLAEDISWRSFIQSVQRLKLVRNST